MAKAKKAADLRSKTKTLTMVIEAQFEFVLTEHSTEQVVPALGVVEEAMDKMREEGTARLVDMTID